MTRFLKVLAVMLVLSVGAFSAVPALAIMPKTESVIMMPRETDNIPVVPDVVTADTETSTIYTSESGSVYTAGKLIEFANPISGDLIAAASKIIVYGPVLDNAYVAGGAVQIDGDVTGDIAVAGGVVIVNGSVSGDVRAFGGVIYINSTDIGGDLVAMGGEVYIGKNVRVQGETFVDKDPENSANVHLNYGSMITKIDDPALSKYVNMYAPDYEYMQPSTTDTDTKAAQGFATGFSLVCNFIWLLGGIIAGYVIVKLFPVFTSKTVATMKSSWLAAIGVGFLTFFGGGIAGVILLCTIIGIPLLGVLALIAFLAGSLASIFARYMVGQAILGGLFKKPNASAFGKVAIGYVLVELVLFLIGLIPFIGESFVSIISFGLFIWAMGSMALNKFRALKQ